MVYIQITYLLIFAIHKTLSVTTNEARSTINHIHNLQQRVEASINTLNLIPQMTRALKSNVHQISSKSRIPRIISSVQSQVSGPTQCSRQARSLVDSLNLSSKEEASVCANVAIKKIESLSIQAGRLILKANDVKNDVVGRIKNCVRTNAPNEVGITLCLVSQVYPVQESIGQLEYEVQRVLDETRQTADDILMVLKDCVSEIEDYTENRSRGILKSYQDCSKSKG